MDRHILGTFTNEEETIKEVNRLINEEGYRSEELALIIDKHNEFDRQINSLKEVRVEKVEVEEESVWEKIKDTFSIGSYDSDAAHSVLEEYGVPHDKAEHYMDALRDGEMVLLADTDAPKHTDLSNLNGEMIDEENQSMNDNKNQHKPVDEVNTEEEQAIQAEKTDKDPKDVETSETDDNQMNESIDPSQAEHTRKESAVEKNETESSKDDSQGKESKEEPDLTGEEDTVEVEESNHNYGNRVAEGVVKPEAKSPLNTDEKVEKEPSEKSDAPESDAKHTDDAEEAGLKSEE
ncbi:DUF2382 domain-containing protein [Alkalibacterium psychrotolerans]